MTDQLYGALIRNDGYRPVFCPCSFGRALACQLVTRIWHDPWQL